MVHDAQKFKDILKTLAVRHQQMMAYHLGVPSFFKPKTHTSRVDSVLVSALPEVTHVYIPRQTTSETVYETSNVTIDGTEYIRGMSVSVGVSGGLSEFCKIAQIYLINHNVSFLCIAYDYWNIEHLLSYELSARPANLSINQLSEFNNTVPLSMLVFLISSLLVPFLFLEADY